MLGAGPILAGNRRNLPRGPIPNPVAWAWAKAGRPVAWIRQLATLQRKTAAADALCESGPEPLELRDTFVDARRPRFRQARPVMTGRCAMRRELGKLCPDLIQCQPDSLREHNERDPAENRSRIPTLATTGPLGPDESPLLIKTKRGCCDATAPRYLADQEQVFHAVESIAART